MNNTDDILTFIGMIGAYLLSFAVAFVITVGLPLLGMAGLLRFLTKRK
ncbi:MAG: hypothetical protein H9535_19780 [Ignavibacteria bacterium]|nr:hypothetical protein [Ignavibacteria bacterium]